MRNRLVLVILVAALAALVAAPAQAHSGGRHAGRVCVPVHATGTGQETAPGQTTATIFVRGVEVGTTTASFTTTGLDGTVASFVGPLVFTSAAGTITAQTTGTLDTATGRFVSRSDDLTGTEAFSGVDGRLRLRGTVDLADGSFTERISGRLCFPRR
jgi:hypothetical protein